MITPYPFCPTASLQAPFVPMTAATPPDEFARLVAQHQRAVCAVAYSAVRDRAKSEEIAQEAFLIAWTKLPSLTEPPKLPAWICGIARNLAKNARRHRSNLEDAAGETLEAHPTTAGDPLHDLLEAESHALVERALAQLDPSYREPLVLFYRHDRSLREVATALDISEANAKQRVSRGRALLAERVTGLVERTLVGSGPSAAFTAAVVAAAVTLPRTARAQPSRASEPTGASRTSATPWLVGAAAALLVSGGVWLGRQPSTSPTPPSRSALAAASTQRAAGATPGPHYRPRRSHGAASGHPAAAADGRAAGAHQTDGLPATVEKALEKPIDLELREVKTGDVLRLLSDVSGVPIVVRGEIADEVSLDLHAVTVQEALDETLDRAEGVWREAEVVRVVAGGGPRGPALEGPKIDMTLSQAPLGAVSQSFIDLFDRAVVVSPELATTPIDIDAHGEPAGQVFARMVEGAGLRYELVTGIEVRPSEDDDAAP